ncbi:kinase-like domain-containing protein [Chytriomyces sp. MP71]|nr:kinase-like domain-containing protein [Chytriomyces sp. MP71]
MDARQSSSPESAELDSGKMTPKRVVSLTASAARGTGGDTGTKSILKDRDGSHGSRTASRSVSVRNHMADTGTDGNPLALTGASTPKQISPKMTPSLSSSRKSMPQMAKVNFGEEQDSDDKNLVADSPPELPKSKTVNEKPRTGSVLENIKAPKYMSALNLKEKKKPLSQQGNAARVQAGLKRSIADGLHIHDTLPQHQSTPITLASSFGSAHQRSALKPNDAARTSNVGAPPLPERASVISVRSKGFRDSGNEKPVIQLYPRKSVTTVTDSEPKDRYGSVSSDSRMSAVDAVRNSKASVSALIPTMSPPKSQLRDQHSALSSAGEIQDSQVTSMPPIGEIKDPNQDYYDYVLLNQRHASSNFITKIGSADLDYGEPQTIVKIIGPYVMGDQIGKGAYGKVKEGLCSETLQRVAIKIINKKRLRKIPNGVENALSEIQLLKRMKNKNVITLIDVYCKVEDDEGNVGIFNWFSTIEKDPVTWTYNDGSVAEKKVTVLKWYLIFEYCPCSLQTLLEQNRDIKAGNLLITPDGVIKISDFGVTEQFSMYQDGQLVSELFAGTHQFMAPEICEGGDGFVAEKVDIWACGVTLFNMITGRYPFEFPEDGNLLGLYERIVSGAFLMPDGLDADLESMLLGLLTKNPAKRLTIAQIQRHPFYLAFFSENQKPQAPIMSYPSTDFTVETPNCPAPIHTMGSITLQTAQSASTNVITSPDPCAQHATPSINLPLPSPHTSNVELSRKKSSASAISKEKKHKYMSIVSMHQKQTPCETTMIPYLTELCGREIEDDLANNKRFIDMMGRDDDYEGIGKEKAGKLGVTGVASNLMRRLSDVGSARSSRECPVGENGKSKITNSDGALNDTASLTTGTSSIKHEAGAAVEKSEVGTIVETCDVRKRKPIKMFFKSLFHGKDSSVKPK